MASFDLDTFFQGAVVEMKRRSRGLNESLVLLGGCWSSPRYADAHPISKARSRSQCLCATSCSSAEILVTQPNGPLTDRQRPTMRSANTASSRCCSSSCRQLCQMLLFFVTQFKDRPPEAFSMGTCQEDAAFARTSTQESQPPVRPQLLVGRCAPEPAATSTAAVPSAEQGP